MWFVIGRDQFSEEFCGWGKSKEEAFSTLRVFVDEPMIGGLKWYFVESQSTVITSTSYTFEEI